MQEESEKRFILEVDQVNQAIQSRMLRIKDSLLKHKQELDTLLKLKQSQEFLQNILSNKGQLHSRYP